MCRSTLTDEQITTLITDIKERLPKVCPCCGSAEIAPTFLLDDEWDCANRECLAVWRTGE